MAAVGEKRPREEAPEGAKKVPNSWSVRGETLLAYRKKLYAALKGEQWGPCEKVLVEMLETMEGEPQEKATGVTLLFREIAEFGADALMEPLVDFLRRDELTKVTYGKNMPEALLSHREALKNISTRNLPDPTICGKAQLTYANISSLRRDTSLFARAVKHNDGIGYAKDISVPTDGIPELYQTIRSKHKTNLPDEKKVAADLRELEVKANKLATLTEATLHTFAGEVEGVVTRLVKALDQLHGSCTALDEATAKAGYPKSKTHMTPRMPTGVWDVVSLKDPVYRLQVYLMCDVVATTVIFKALDEMTGYNPRNPTMKQKKEEATVTKMKNLRATLFGSLRKTMPGGEQLVKSIKGEQWREAVWGTWKKKYSCPGRTFDGAEGALEGTKKRKDDKDKCVSTFSPRVFKNTVTLPNKARASLPKAEGGFPLGNAPSKNPPSPMPDYGTGEWVQHYTATATMPREFLASDELPELPPAFTPPPLSTLSLTSAPNLWVATRLLAATNLDLAAEDCTYYLLDNDVISNALSK